MIRPDDIMDEGHTKEWEDRARVIIDPEKDMKAPASPHQSPTDDETGNQQGSEIKNKQLREKNNENY